MPFFQDGGFHWVLKNNAYFKFFPVAPYVHFSAQKHLDIFNLTKQTLAFVALALIKIVT